MQNQLHPIFWLWIPIFVFLGQVVAKLTLPYSEVSSLYNENGLFEILQFFTLVAAIIVCLVYLAKESRINSGILSGWFVLAMICCIYVAGEEVSWGQHIIGWATPEEWAQYNDQNETNIHNTSSWFDQKPRLLLLIGICFGSLIMPYLSFIKNMPRDQFLSQVTPPKISFVIALIILVPHLVEKILETYQLTFFSRYSEIQETYMFYFVFVYLLNLRLNLKQAKKD
ncbi:MAG: hypothetical protein AAF549_02905 [Pseudomonadota bacterium]